jgi:hypothetical protein
LGNAIRNQLLQASFLKKIRGPYSFKNGFGKQRALGVFHVCKLSFPRKEAEVNCSVSLINGTRQGKGAGQFESLRHHFPIITVTSLFTGNLSGTSE